MTHMPPTHCHHWPWPVSNHQLQVAGRDLSSWATQAGEQPFYLYSRERMRTRMSKLRELLPAELGIHYAIKANPHPAVVQEMAALADGLDVASLQELNLATNTGMAAEHISFAGPGKTDVELAAACAAGIVINIESTAQLQRLRQIAATMQKRAKVALRINPDFALKTAGMQMSGGPQPFGVDAESAPLVLAKMKAAEFDFIGLHIFSGSQNLKADAIIASQQQAIDLAEQLAEHCPGPIKTLNIGGGFGIPYFPGDAPLDVAAIGQYLQQAMAQLKQRWPHTQLVVELGRHLVGEAGLYVCQVLERKKSRGQQYLITNGGMHHHLAASGNFGQIIRKNYPTLLGNKADLAATELVNVVGPLCTPLDVLANKVNLPQADVGDLLVLTQSGAYGASASPQHFLSHPAPLELVA